MDTTQEILLFIYKQTKTLPLFFKNRSIPKIWDRLKLDLPQDTLDLNSFQEMSFKESLVVALLPVLAHPFYKSVALKRVDTKMLNDFCVVSEMSLTILETFLGIIFLLPFLTQIQLPLFLSWLKRKEGHNLF